VIFRIRYTIIERFAFLLTYYVAIMDRRHRMPLWVMHQMSKREKRKITRDDEVEKVSGGQRTLRERRINRPAVAESRSPPPLLPLGRLFHRQSRRIRGEGLQLWAILKYSGPEARSLSELPDWATFRRLATFWSCRRPKMGCGDISDALRDLKHWAIRIWATFHTLFATFRR